MRWGGIAPLVSRYARHLRCNTSSTCCVFLIHLSIPWCIYLMYLKTNSIWFFTNLFWPRINIFFQAAWSWTCYTSCRFIIVIWFWWIFFKIRIIFSWLFMIFSLFFIISCNPLVILNEFWIKTKVNCFFATGSSIRVWAFNLQFL